MTAACVHAVVRLAWAPCEVSTWLASVSSAALELCAHLLTSPSPAGRCAAQLTTSSAVTHRWPASADAGPAPLIVDFGLSGLTGTDRLLVQVWHTQLSSSVVATDTLTVALRHLRPALEASYQSAITASQRRQQSILARLSPPQHVIVDLLVRGHTEDVIAARVHRSRHTIHDHVKRIYAALGINSRLELVMMWHALAPSSDTPASVTDE